MLFNSYEFIFVFMPVAVAGFAWLSSKHHKAALLWLTGGEGLHNNHHEYPSSALFALRRREIDPAWLVIRLLDAVGLARVKPVPVGEAEAA